MTTTDIMTETGEIGGTLPKGESGWQRIDVWAGGCSAGDDAIIEFSAYYERDTGAPMVESFEIIYYVVSTPTQFDGDEEPTEAWGVEERSWFFRRDADGDTHDDEFDYEMADYRFFFSVEAAAECARALALQDLVDWGLI